MQPNSNLNINKSQKIFQLHRIKNNNEITVSTSKENIKNNNSVTNINNNESKILFPFLGKDKTNSNEMYIIIYFSGLLIKI
jgi:hypothetical protein